MVFAISSIRACAGRFEAALESEVNNFESRLADAAVRVEARLAQLLAAQASPATPERLAAALQHAVLGGGKRFRPFLVIECARLFDAPAAAAVEVAAALECVHCYSLVHDDLPGMDNDEIRRGRPTVWKAFDEWTAILAGDGLLTVAFEILADLGPEVPDHTKLELIRRLAVDAGRAGMVGGQAIDLDADKRGLPIAPDMAHIRRLQAMKTGALIRYGAEAGALLGGASGPALAQISAYAEALGLAFQISDDLLDTTGDAARVGKAVGKDAALGKATLVSLMGVDAARQELDRVVAAAIASLSSFGARSATLAAAARYMGARDR